MTDASSLPRAPSADPRPSASDMDSAVPSYHSNSSLPNSSPQAEVDAQSYDLHMRSMPQWWGASAGGWAPGVLAQAGGSGASTGSGSRSKVPSRISEEFEGSHEG